MKKFAFTLAETLLTLAIIGVIAALTIPGLKENSDEKRYVTSAQKSFATISAATTMLETKYGDAFLWPWTSYPTIVSRYQEVMNSLPDFAGSSYTIQTMDGNRWGTVSKDSYWFQTADNMTWSMGPMTSQGIQGGIGIIYVDTNGSSMPNVVGVDVMGFYITADGLYPIKSGDFGCTYYVMKAGKMPWLSDSSYRSCKDQRISEI